MLDASFPSYDQDFDADGDETIPATAASIGVGNGTSQVTYVNTAFSGRRLELNEHDYGGRQMEEGGGSLVHETSISFQLEIDHAEASNASMQYSLLFSAMDVLLPGDPALNDTAVFSRLVPTLLIQVGGVWMDAAETCSPPVDIDGPRASAEKHTFELKLCPTGDAVNEFRMTYQAAPLANASWTNASVSSAGLAVDLTADFIATHAPPQLQVCTRH